MLAGLDGDRLLDGVQAAEVDADLPDAGKPLGDLLAAQVAQVETDVTARKALALGDLGLYRTSDEVARGQLHHLGGVALHEALTIPIEQMAPFAPGAFGDKNIGSKEGGR